MKKYDDMKLSGKALKGLLALLVVLFFGQVQGQKAEIETLIQNERYEEALKKVQAALGEEPKDEELDYLKGRIHFLMDDLGAARESYNNGVGHGRTYPMNYIGLASVAVRNKDFDLAQEKLTKANDVNKKGEMAPMLGIAAAWMEWPGKVLEGANYYKEAEAMLLKVSTKYPDAPEGFTKLGELYDLKGIQELAQTYYEKAIELDESYLNGHFRLGQLKKRQKKYTEAAKHFQKALELDAKYAPALKEMAEMWYLAKDYEKGEDFYNQYLSIMGGDLKAKMRLGIFQYLGEQYDKSISTLETLIGQLDDPLLYRILAYDYIKKEEPDGAKALEYFDKYFEMAPEKFIIPMDYQNKGMAMSINGNDSLAVMEYEKAMKMSADQGEPNNEMYLEIADMFKGKKRYDKQAEFLEKYLATKTRYDMKNSYALGRAYYFAKDYVKAGEVFTKMREERSDLYLGWLWEAKSLAAQDPSSTEGLAKPAYEKLAEILEGDEAQMKKYNKYYLEACRYLGAYHTLISKDYETAVPYWEHILEATPEDPGATEGLKFCKQVIESNG